MAAMYALPGLIGVFWGAPLIARELETGTHRLVWNQSVTRRRWLLVKLIMGVAIAAAATGLLSWAVTAWAAHVDSASEDRITPLVFGARGIVPVAYAVFVFMLGVTSGMLIRRALPAMAATLAIYVAAVATFTGPADLTVCGRQEMPTKCEEWIVSLGLRQDIIYQPGSHFWSLQWAEAGVFVGLAALLAGFCFWWIRHRVA